MRRRRPDHMAPLAAIVVVAVLVTACGPSASSPSTSSPSASRGASPTAPATAAPSATAVAPTATSPAGSPASAAPSAAAFDPTGVTVKAVPIVDGLDAPLDVTNAGDGSGRLFVVEQAGRIRIVADGKLLAKPFLDIRGRISSGGERGLLGLAFHPGYPADPRFIVDYTDLDGNTVVSSFTVDPKDPNVADPDSEKVYLHITQPYANHNGGAVLFGPDGKLYIAMGDGGSGGDPQGNGQRLDTLLAKILRIDVDATDGDTPYAIPPDNPFVSTKDARPEIWTYGMRNPWRMRFDTATGDLWIGDVGQGAYEEIDVVRAGSSGQDFGWNTMEGFHCYSPSDGCDKTGLTLPVAEYGHDEGCAVIGGVVVHDPSQSAIDGGYVFSDDCSGNLWLLDPSDDGPQTPVIAGRTGLAISAIGEGEDGAVYATDLGGGTLLRIEGSR